MIEKYLAMTSRAEKEHESASVRSFSNICFWLDFHRMLQAPRTGPRGVRLGVPVLGERLLPPAALHKLPQIYSFNYKKVVLLSEGSDDVARCTGGTGSIGVCCLDGKLILGIWEKSLENHGLHLDLLSY